MCKSDNNSNNKDDETTSSVVLKNYGQLLLNNNNNKKNIDPYEWPIGLANILDNEKIKSSSSIGNDNNNNVIISSDEYLQTYVRYCLLRKYGYINDNDNDTSNSSIRVLEYNDIKKIQFVQEKWKQVVTDAIMKKNNNNNTEESNNNNDDDLINFIQTNCITSNNRILEWTVMYCKPNIQFNIHAHPNIEVIYCIQGSIHEIRMDGKPIQKNFQQQQKENTNNTDDENEESSITSSNCKVIGPSLLSIQRPWSFKTISEGQILINEVGSIHKSFTGSKGCILLTLWSGSHANITTPPTSPNIQNIINQFYNNDDDDNNLCNGCSSDNYSKIGEIFLPDSEKSTK